MTGPETDFWGLQHAAGSSFQLLVLPSTGSGTSGFGSLGILLQSPPQFRMDNSRVDPVGGDSNILCPPVHERICGQITVM